MAKKKDKKANANPDSDGQDSKKSGPGLVSQIIIAMALGAASFVTVYMLPDRANAASEMKAKTEHTVDPLDGVFPSQTDLTYIKLDDLTLTLGDLDRILKIGITLEVIDTGELYVDPSDPLLRDAFTGYLRSLRTEQIEDASFMVQLRAQLLRRAQLVLGTDTIHGVLITDFLVR